MARRHPKKRREAEIQVSAFSDIAFLLIIFFILATTLVHVTGIVADMPSGENTKKEEEKKTATVSIVNDQILIDDKNVTIKELRKRLADMKLPAKSEEDKVVLLTASGHVTYQTYFDVMASISAAGGVTAILQEEE